MHVVALLEQRLGGGVSVIIANTNDRPATVTITLGAGTVSDGVADVLFSSRNVTVAGDTFTDWVDAMGTRAFRLTPSESIRTADPWFNGPEATPNPSNILYNPSFELTGGGIGGGMPDGFYGTVKGDADAAAFSDPRDSVHCLHSLRIHTPSAGNGQTFSHFMCPASLMHPDTDYELSVWARGKSFSASTNSDMGDLPVLLLGFQELRR